MIDLRIPIIVQGVSLDCLKITPRNTPRKRRVVQPINPPIFTALRDGSPIVLVQLTNADQFAIVDQEDWERLMDQGISPNWFLVYCSAKDDPADKRYWTVRVALADKKPVQQTNVSRLIANAGKGETIHMADGNILNLRRSNLVRGRKPKTTKTHKE